MMMMMRMMVVVMMVVMLHAADHQADPNLTVDEGCVVLGDANNIMAKRGRDWGASATCRILQVQRYLCDLSLNQISMILHNTYL